MPEMKTMLLLTERAEPANPVSSNVPPVTIHEGDATLGCSCDRWGHPRLASRWSEPRTHEADSRAREQSTRKALVRASSNV